MRGQLINGCSFGAVLHDVPHSPLRYTISPSLARSANAPKHATFTQSCGRKPRVNGAVDPVRYGHRPNMPGLANQINDRPVIIPALKMSNIQFCPSSGAARNPKGSVSLALQRIRVRHLPERSCLVGGEPVTETDAEVLRPFDSADASSEIRAEQTGVGSFVCETSDRRKPAVDCARRKLTRFQVNSITSPTALLSDSLGSEQYQATNSSIACR